MHFCVYIYVHTNGLLYLSFCNIADRVLKISVEYYYLAVDQVINKSTMAMCFDFIILSDMCLVNNNNAHKGTLQISNFL